MTGAARFLIGLVTCFATHDGIPPSRAPRGARRRWAATRGGLSTKIHAAVDRRGCSLAILLTPGQAGDAPMMLALLAHLRVQRTIGPPRTRPDRVPADKVYCSRAIRAHLRTRGIGSVIPELDDQKATASASAHAAANLLQHRSMGSSHDYNSVLFL